MGIKAAIAGPIVGAATFAIEKLFLEAPFLYRPGWVVSQGELMLATGAEALFAGALGYGVYKGVRDSEKQLENERQFEEYLERKAREPKIMGTVKEAFKPVTSVVSSAKDISKNLAAHLEGTGVDLSHVRPIPGTRGAMYDITSGRYKKWVDYMQQHPELANQPPEVQRVRFEKDVFRRKLDIESVRKDIEEIRRQDEEWKRQYEQRQMSPGKLPYFTDLIREGNLFRYNDAVAETPDKALKVWLSKSSDYVKDFGDPESKPTLAEYVSQNPHLKGYSQEVQLGFYASNVLNLSVPWKENRRQQQGAAIV